MKLKRLVVEEMPVKAGQGHVPVPEQAKVGKVVDRQQGTGGGQLGNTAINGLEVDRDEPGLPVVAVDHIGPDPQQANGLEHGPVKEDKSRAVVLVVVAADLVELVAA